MQQPVPFEMCGRGCAHRGHRAASRCVRFADDVKPHDGLRRGAAVYDALWCAFAASAMALDPAPAAVADACGDEATAREVGELLADLSARILIAAAGADVPALEAGGGGAIKVGRRHLFAVQRLQRAVRGALALLTVPELEEIVMVEAVEAELRVPELEDCAGLPPDFEDTPMDAEGDAPPMAAAAAPLAPTTGA